ncbi:UDP-N-acetyl glucosamine 2-epimerase [Salinadaptatus halalkaliphilus]|uniref:UDP-N-acetyl glucosamine 2-epimerase n=1 Tax=Salinadaptatus halalkaliphilus TaxID=2419781 RepID=A0A4S3TK16_9EURY|nr:UDP-N-acetyl glucosamine 2-epimerase [Salinadaptatus halalkaliphilus]THE64434.1 UDP-N-acetyl glucosamine 2-epimerase [Salinadaptatus halalkaliphilus]
MKIVSIVGARPQFVKAFVVSRRLEPDHEELLVHTGQHYSDDLSAVFFEELSIPDPDYNLGVGSDTHGRQTAAMIEGIEEINRVLTDHVSDLLFAPSDLAKTMLEEEEGITDGVHVVGDVGYDAIRWAKERAVDDVFDRLGIEPGEYVLSTVHRAKNTNNPARLEAIFGALAATPKQVIIPIHPRTAGPLREYGLWEETTRAHTVIDPVGYLDFVRLLEGAERVVTDSGGVQKEAFYLETPCVTLREETEWRETVECGWNRLVGADRTAILEGIAADSWPESAPPIYGDGHTAAKLVAILEERIGTGPNSD